MCRTDIDAVDGHPVHDRCQTGTGSEGLNRESVLRLPPHKLRAFLTFAIAQFRSGRGIATDHR